MDSHLRIKTDRLVHVLRDAILGRKLRRPQGLNLGKSSLQNLVQPLEFSNYEVESSKNIHIFLEKAIASRKNNSGAYLVE